MPRIQVEKVTFGYTDTLFKNVTFSIGDNDRVGIVGNNGSGKSTLLKCIAGLIEPHEGRIIYQKGLKFGFMEQDIPKKIYDTNFYDFMSDAISASDKIHSLWKVDATLDIFNVPDNLRKKSIKELSGGWQRLALIARLVLSNPDLLILDEPTNHLDGMQILALEKLLNEYVYNIPLVSVSHDRRFLANCTNKTIFLRGTQIHKYNYSYVQAKYLLNEEDNASFAQREKETKEINRLKRSAHDLRQIGVNNYSEAALRKSLQIAKRAEGIENQLTNVPLEAKGSIKLSNSGTHAKKLIGLKDIDIYTPDGLLLFHIDQFDIKSGERVIIHGPNGSGKSQFLKYLQKAVNNVGNDRMSGVSITPTIKLGYIDQHLSHLPLEKSLYDYFDQEFALLKPKLTGLLVNAGFSILTQQVRLGSLSHGQRARVAFLMLHLVQPNFYIMDEPTNHLDIAGQEQLESEILEKEAASVVVSHDRAFTQNIGTRFYRIHNKQLFPMEQ